MLKTSESDKLQKRLHAVIPGGAHTYAKGDDQYPEYYAPVLVRGKGCHVWDADGNKYIEYGMGLRAVSLGHAYAPVVEAAYEQMKLGSNFVRPTAIEATAAEALLDLIPAGQMVKFGKNGSDATTAAVKLARAYTGKNTVAICKDHPFFSVNDWFIGTTAINRGCPQSTIELTKYFEFNRIESVKALFEQYPDSIACLIMEPEKDVPVNPEFLVHTKRLCEQYGALLILDEMITGFRWHLGGAQTLLGFEPHLSTFGKALGNGFSVSALMGKKEIMKLGGLEHNSERV
ncbi:MAG: aminotransferase class III-fold pyridoxal phosphate-dependent enzyme, partial [Cyclobacteriaceae bacterium]